MNKRFQLPVIVVGVKTTADKALELKLHTRDVKSFPEKELALLMGTLDKEYWTLFSELPPNPEDIEVGEERVDKGQKTAAQRLRGVIYRIWERSNSGVDSETHYVRFMEQIMDQLKGKYLD